MFIYIGGVPGVGKTTIIRNVEKIAKNNGIKMKGAQGSPILCQLTGSKNTDELRLLPEKIRSRFRSKMYEILYEEDAQDINTIRLSDGHFVYYDVKGKKYSIRKIQPNDKKQLIAIVVVVANVNNILERRLKDSTNRSDRKKDINFIIKEQEMEVENAKLQAKKLSIPFCFINNDEIEKAARAIFYFCTQQMSSHKIINY